MSFFTGNHRDSQLSVTNQPQANLNLGSLDFKQSIPVHEKSLDASLEDSHHHHCEHGQTSEHHSCHNIRLRRFLLPAIFALLALGGLLAWSCVNWHSMPAWGVDLIGRALGDNSTTSTQSPFVRNRLWLIVLLVGLVVVLVLGIMLSFCCCKAAFENPLCCPCYLCACCGGLACLECIGCGLCCSAAESVA